MLLSLCSEAIKRFALLVILSSLPSSCLCRLNPIESEMTLSPTVRLFVRQRTESEQQDNWQTLRLHLGIGIKMSNASGNGPCSTKGMASRRFAPALHSGGPATSAVQKVWRCCAYTCESHGSPHRRIVTRSVKQIDMMVSCWRLGSAPHLDNAAGRLEAVFDLRFGRNSVKVAALLLLGTKLENVLEQRSGILAAQWRNHLIPDTTRVLVCVVLKRL